jgi:hypothetical protein
LIAGWSSGLDEGFIGRTYRSCGWVLGLVLLFLWGLGKFQAMWSVAAGTALGLGVLRGFEWLTRSLVRPGQAPRPRPMVKVVALKLPAMALLIYGVVRSGWFDLAAFAGGVALVQIVIFLKAVGLFLVQRQEDQHPQAGCSRNGIG